jgi:DNA-binding transcriptional regulator LsrR (DeoR family)
VDFVGEETYPDRDTIARPVAQRHNVRWHSVELPLEMRNQLGIEENQQSRPLPPNETRVSSHGVREEYMVKTVLEKAENAQTALIVCGCIHAGALVERFRRAGHPADRFVT